MSIVQRYFQDEGIQVLDIGVQIQFSVMEGSNLAGICQAQSGAVLLYGLALIESIENEFALFFGNVSAIILNPDYGISVLL